MFGRNDLSEGGKTMFFAAREKGGAPGGGAVLIRPLLRGGQDVKYKLEYLLIMAEDF